MQHQGFGAGHQSEGLDVVRLPSEHALKRRHRLLCHALEQEVASFEQIGGDGILIDLAHGAHGVIDLVKIKCRELHAAQERPGPRVMRICLEGLFQFIRRGGRIIVLEKTFRGREMGGPIAPVDLIVRAHEHIEDHIVEAQLMLIGGCERRPAIDRAADERYLFRIIKRLGMPDPLLQIIVRIGHEPLIGAGCGGDVAELLEIFA